MTWMFRNRSLLLVSTLSVFGQQAIAQTITCPVGVNVNSFQNMDAADQQQIVSQLKASGVRFLRTSLRLDEKDIALAKNLQASRIGLVAVLGLQFSPRAPLRPADLQRHLRSAMPLSYADTGLSKAAYEKYFQKLDDNGIVLTGIELGNELNWTDFNGDFPIPGQGKAFTLEDLSQDPEAKRVARGLLQYVKIAAVLKEVRDHSKLNNHAPIISAGMAAVSGGAWQQELQADSVSIPATYAFLRANGLDNFVDGYGVHDYPKVIAAGDKAAVEKRSAEMDRKIFPADNTKPYWLTEWGFSSTAGSSVDDQTRARSVAEIRNYLTHLLQQKRLGGIFWYVWNEPDHSSIYRNGVLLEAGREAVAPLTAR